MNQEKSKTYEWLKRMPTPIVCANKIPMFGYPPLFPWDEISKNFAEKFEVDDFLIKASSFKLLQKKDLFKKLGTPLVPMKFSVYPFEGYLIFALPKDDILELMSQITMIDSSKKDFLPDEYEKAFYHLMALSFIQALNESEFDKNIKPAIIEDAAIPQEDTLASDITISIGKNKFIGRCYISYALQQSVTEHFVKEQENAPFKDAVAEKLPVVVHLEAGNVSMTTKEWSEVKSGDFVILDNCSLKQGADKGRVFLTVNGHHLFRGKIKDGNLTIVEYPL